MGFDNLWTLDRLIYPVNPRTFYPAALELIVRANVEFSDTPITQDRADFAGTLEQIAADVAETRGLGVTEIVFDAQFSSGVKKVEDIVALMEQLRQVA